MSTNPFRQFRFKGDPSSYQWDFPIDQKAIYQGTIWAYHRHSIEELYDIAVKYKDKDFLQDWEEIKEPVNN